MDTFACNTRQPCHLVLPDCGAAVVVAQASSLDAWEFQGRVGARLDLLETGSGQALLAFQDVARRSRTLAIWGAGKVEARLAELESDLATIRAQGYRIGHRAASCLA